MRATRRLHHSGLALVLAGVLLALLIGTMGILSGTAVPVARAQGIGVITHTRVVDFAAGCANSTGISVGNREGGELHLTASVEDDFDGAAVDTTRWITNISNPDAGSYQSLIMANGLITLDGVYLRSVLAITQLPRFFEARARLMQRPNTSGSVDLGFYREIGPLYNPPLETSSIRLFVLGNGDPNDLIVRVRDDGGPIGDYNIPDPDETQFHVFRIEWEPNVTRYFIDGARQAEVFSNTTVITSWVFLYHQSPSFYGSTPLDVDWVRAGQYATMGIFNSCQQDAGQKVQWNTLSWDADMPAGTGLAFRVRTSMDGVSWSEWSDPLPAGSNNIPRALAFARYLQYRVEMSTTNPMFSPEVREIVLSFSELADLVVSKSASADSVLAGNELTYTIRVTNNGPLNAPDVRVTDTLPAGVSLVGASPSSGTCTGSVCNLGTLNAGSSALIALRVRVNPSTPAGWVTNTVAASTTLPDDPANNSASMTTQVQTQADLSLSLSDDPDPVIAGNPITYTAILTNNGPSDAQTVGVNFTFPSGLTLLGLSPSQGACSGAACNLGLLPAGTAARITVTARVNASAPEGSLTVQAQAASSTTDPNVANNTASATTQVRTQADLALTMNDTPDPVFAGDPLTYTLTVTSSGPSDARDVRIDLTLADGLTPLRLSASQGTCEDRSCSLGTLPPGSIARITTTVRVNSNVTNGSYLTTLATVSSITTDPNSTNNTATATTRVQTQADLSLSLSDDPDPVIAGNPITYTAILTNNGPSDAQTVGVNFTFPSGLTLLGLSPSQGACSGAACNLGLLPAGAAARITVTARVNASAPEGTLTTQAQAASSTTDPNVANNAASATTQVQTQADLSLSLSDDPDPVIAGRALVYRLTAINQGPSDARNVQLTLTLPTEVSLLSFVPDICTATSSTIRCDRDRLTAGDMFTMVVTVTVRADLNQGYVLIARAEGISLTTDPAPDNNTAIASTEVVLEADLQAALTGEPAEVFVGDVITYTLTVTNAGPSKASGVIVTLNLPPGLNVEDVLASSGSCSIGTPRCELGELAVGAIATVRWRVRVAQWPGTPISVQGEVSTDAVDPNPADNRPEIQTAVRFRVFLPLIFR